MGQRWTSDAGWQVELIDDDGTQIYRVTGHNGLYVGICYTLEDLERFLASQDITMSDLTELP